MILSNINKYKNIHKLFKLINYLNKLQTSKHAVKSSLPLLKKNSLQSRLVEDTKVLIKNQTTVRYIINIMFSSANTIINLTDVKGNSLITISEKSVNVSKDSKKFQLISAVKMFQKLLLHASFIKDKAVVLNFRNTKRYQESFCIKLLQTKVFIKSIQNYTFVPHNGCRPKKLKRVKLRTKRLVLK